MPGVYYVSVAGTGAGDPSVDGYTSYGSLGQFWLDMAFAAGTLPAVPAPHVPQVQHTHCIASSSCFCLISWSMLLVWQSSPAHRAAGVSWSGTKQFLTQLSRATLLLLAMAKVLRHGQLLPFQAQIVCFLV